jgi:hypothetical protein
MPLKGHARNMVSAYARYLGLNPEEVTKQFLSEYREFEGRETRHSSAPLGSAAASVGHFEAQPIPPSYTGKRAESQGVRSMWNKPIPRSELSRSRDSRSQAARRVAEASSRQRPRASIERPSGSRPSGSRSSGSRRQTSDSYTPRQSLPTRIAGSLFGNPVVLITVLVLILVALLIVWAMAANSCKKQGEERNITASGGAVVNEEGVTGGADATTGTGEAGETGETNGTSATGSGEGDDARYGAFELVVEQVPGSSPWVRVTVDGQNVYEGTLSEKLSWQVTASSTVLTAQPDNVKVTRNGEAASFAGNDEGTYSVTLTVEERPADAAGTTDATGATGTTGTTDAAGQTG